MGNAKAKRLYEAFLPECFQRPESDQAAEIFIRDKYDKKKYMDKVIDIQMLRVSSLMSVSSWICVVKDNPSKLLAMTNMMYKMTHFSLYRKKRAATTSPRSPLCLRRWNWWVHRWTLSSFSEAFDSFNSVINLFRNYVSNYRVIKEKSVQKSSWFSQKKEISPKTNSQSVTDLLGLGNVPFSWHVTLW